MLSATNGKIIRLLHSILFLLSATRYLSIWLEILRESLCFTVIMGKEGLEP